MLFRRNMLSVGSVLAVSGLVPGVAGAQTAGAFDVVRDWDFLPPTVAPEQAEHLTAAGPARSVEIAKAFRLLFGAPRGKKPVEVAKYFEELRKTEKPIREGYYWNEEWPIGRPNPLIVGFFSMTNTLPNKGDETYWCAAFVNFCLAVAQRPLNWSVWALDFVKYGEPTNDPQIGDIVVLSRPGGGHVGFYLGRYQRDGRDAGITVLGGNQGGGSPRSAGAVSEGKIAFASSYEVKGYRVIPPAVSNG